MSQLPSGVRRVGSRFQAYFSDAGHGKTACFSSELEAAAWALERRKVWRCIGKRTGARTLPRASYEAKARLPVGVTYSAGKWFARSPRWWPERVCRVFSEAKWGRRIALLKAMAVAKRWLQA